MFVSYRCLYWLLLIYVIRRNVNVLEHNYMLSTDIKLTVAWPSSWYPSCLLMPALAPVIFQRPTRKYGETTKRDTPGETLPSGIILIWRVQKVLVYHQGWAIEQINWCTSGVFQHVLITLHSSHVPMTWNKAPQFGPGKRCHQTCHRNRDKNCRMNRAAAAETQPSKPCCYAFHIFFCGSIGCQNWKGGIHLTSVFVTSMAAWHGPDWDEVFKHHHRELCGHQPISSTTCLIQTKLLRLQLTTTIINPHPFKHPKVRLSLNTFKKQLPLLKPSAGLGQSGPHGKIETPMLQPRLNWTCLAETLSRHVQQTKLIPTKSKMYTSIYMVS